MVPVTERFVRWLRLSRLTQVEVARQLGRHRSFISQLKKGVKRPTLDDAVKLEAMTGIPAGAWATPRRATKRSAKKSIAAKPIVAREKTVHAAG
jgi:transcriptional regulator with XRE-family HTH domain